VADEPEIKALQVWERRGSRGQRKATGQVTVCEVIRDAEGEVEEIVLDYHFSHGKYTERQGRITPAGLRRRYRLVAEQATLV
jgi:hypothetical protein